MRHLLLAASLAVATLATGPAFAQPPAPAASAKGVQLSPAAQEAAQVVNAFMAALAGGQLEDARRLMTPEAVVIANGQVFGVRDNYIDGPAKGDAAALGTVQRELLRRDVRADGNTAWVLSEKRVRPMAATDGGPSEVVIETMLLARTTAGWKITHIHWSGRHSG